MMIMCQYLIILLVAVTCKHAVAFGVDFQALDAREPFLRLQRSYLLSDSSQNKNSDPEVESVVDVLLTPLVAWGQGVAVGNMSDHCLSMMYDMAEQGGNLTHCLVSHSRPFRVCEKCVKHYTRFYHLYKDLLDDDKCSQILLMSDRMQVITSLNDIFTSTWSRADCDSCYDSIKENATTGKVTYNYTAETILFLELQASVSLCFKNYSHSANHSDNSSEVCHVCKHIYKEMNINFSNLNKQTGGHICMDLVDMMNYTRLMWSNHFNCSRPWVDASVIIAISVVVFIITILLYSTSKVVAKIRMPQIFNPKRMKTRKGRYGAISQIEEPSDCPYLATSSVQAEHRRRQLCTDAGGSDNAGTSLQSS